MSESTDNEGVGHTDSEPSALGAETQSGEDTTSTQPVDVARQLLEGVRYDDPTASLLRRLADADEEALTALRTERSKALAFWLNVYNAAAQLLLDRRPDLFETRWRFFRARAVTVAGVGLSLDDIEHGILRDSHSKYGFGYLPRLARVGLDASYRVERDPRIHFALNCGAVSCPAVLAYDWRRVDGILDDATRSYLDGTVEYDAEHDRVTVPRVCLWFVGDFGGVSGIRSLLREYKQLPPGSSPSIRFAAYDWSKRPRFFGERSD